MTDESPKNGVESSSGGVAVAAPVDADGEVLLSSDLPDEVLRIQLDKFEGPFEVLLYLIRSQEIDIFDIPILKVTEQYLRFLELLREENLDAAGEFLVMAATLIQIKSRMLIPVEVEEEEEIEEEDPRLELVEKLLEYRRFRDLAQSLGDREEQTAQWFPRTVKPVIEASAEEEYIEVSLYDLIKAIRAVLRFLSDAGVHEVSAEGASVDEKVAHIERLLAERESVTWTELYRECRTKTELVCCLLAILELCRMERIRAHQHRSFGDIRIFAREVDAAPDTRAAEGSPDVVPA